MAIENKKLKSVVTEVDSYISSSTVRDKHIEKMIRDYITANQTYLSTNGFGRERLIFPEKISEMFVQAYLGGPSKVTWNKFIDDHEFLDRKYMKIATNILNVGLTVSYVDSLQRGKKNNVFILMFFLKELSSKLYKYQKYGFNKEMMEYILEHYASKSYLSAKYSTISEVISHTMQTTLALYDERLITGTDYWIKEFCNTVTSRINTLINNIKGLYVTYENKTASQILSVKSNYGSDDYEELSTSSSQMAELKNTVDHILLNDRYNANLPLAPELQRNEIRFLFVEDIDMVKALSDAVIDEFLNRYKNISSRMFNKDFLKFTLSSRRYSDDVKKSKDDIIKWYKKKYKSTNKDAELYYQHLYRYLASYIYSITIKL